MSSMRALQLAALLVVLSSCSDQDSQEAMAIGRSSARVGLLCDALAMHFVSEGTLPNSFEELEAILTAPDTGFLRSRVLTDEWNRQLLYERQDHSATIASLGADAADESDNIICALSFDVDRSLVSQTRLNFYGGKTDRSNRPFVDYRSKPGPQ